MSLSREKDLHVEKERTGREDGTFGVSGSVLSGSPGREGNAYGKICLVGRGRLSKSHHAKIRDLDLIL